MAYNNPISKLSNKPSALGANINLKIKQSKIDEIIDAVNDLLDGTVTITSIPGPLTITSTTDTTSPTTGALIVSGGVGIAKALSVGTNILLGKEVNHTINVITTTTAATAGGNITITSGTGATTGAGGDLTLTGGTGGATAGSTGGIITITSGVSGAGGGPSGTVTIRSGAATSTGASGAFSIGSGASVSGNSGNVLLRSGAVSTSGNSGTVDINSGASTTSGNTGNTTFGSGNATSGTSGTVGIASGTSTTGSGTVTISTGNTSAGATGNIVLSPGTTSSTTVSPIIKGTSNLVYQRLGSSVASGGTITGKQLVDGHITATGGTGNWQLPTAALIAAAIGGTVSVGTFFDFSFNAVSMTGGDTATLVVGANMTAKSAITGGTTLTLTQAADAVATFRITFIDAGTNCVISRLS